MHCVERSIKLVLINIGTTTYHHHSVFDLSTCLCTWTKYTVQSPTSVVSELTTPSSYVYQSLIDKWKITHRVMKANGILIRLSNTHTQSCTCMYTVDSVRGALLSQQYYIIASVTYVSGFCTKHTIRFTINFNTTLHMQASPMWHQWL